MNYLLFKEWNENEINQPTRMNWKGLYTCGSTTCRGTRVLLTPLGGLSFYDQTYEKASKDLTTEHGLYRNDNTSMSKESLDEIIENLKSRYTKNIDISYESYEISIDRLEKILSKDLCQDDDDNDNINKNENEKYMNDLRLLNILNFVDIDSMYTCYLDNKEVIKNTLFTNMILFNESECCVDIIYNVNSVINELEYFNNIAKTNGVEFCWI